jgi:hypothetical protein
MSYDIHFQSTAGAVGKKPVSFGYTATVAVRGLPKMVNRWLKCVLTPKGSDPTAKDEGTEFTRLIGSNVGSPQDALDAAALAFEDANDQLRAWDRLNLPPPDEQFGSATVVRVVELQAGGFDIWVQLKNIQGARTNMKLPTAGS